MIRKCFVLVCVLILSGCASLFETHHRESEMEKFVREANIRWKGKTAYALVKQMGRANRMDSDGAGGHILVWIHQSPVRTPIYEYYNVNSNQNNNVTPPPTTTVYKPPQNSITEGDMKWNPYFERWEWKSKTTTQNGWNIRESVRQGQSNMPRSFSDVIVENQRRNQKRIVGYTTSYKVVELKFYINSNDRIYLFNIKEM